MVLAGEDGSSVVGVRGLQRHTCLIYVPVVNCELIMFLVLFLKYQSSDHLSDNFSQTFKFTNVNSCTVTAVQTPQLILLLHT